MKTYLFNNKCKMAKKRQGTAGRFGARYGNTLRRKVSEIERDSRKKYTSPFSKKQNSVKRVAFGIWKCKHTKKVFVGKAYKPY